MFTGSYIRGIIMNDRAVLHTSDDHPVDADYLDGFISKSAEDF
jgi:hypothetical protein